MSDSRLEDFFYSGNAVHGELDYGLADNFVRTAGKIHIALDSVKTARRRLYGKLGVSNITEAISIRIPVHFSVQMNLRTAIVHFCVQRYGEYIGNFEN